MGRLGFVVVVGGGGGGVLCGWSTAALAEPSAKERAQKLFEEGIRLMERGQFDEACPTLEESDSLDPAGGTALDLGYCYEHRGDLARACDFYLVAKERATKSGRKDRVERAGQKLKALAPRVAHTRIVLEEPSLVGRATLRIDSRDIAIVAAETPTFLATGTHRFHLTAEGHEPWSATQDVTAETTEIVLPRLSPVPSAPAPISDAAPAAAVPAAARAHEEAAPRPKAQRSNAPWVVGAASIAALGVAGVTGGLAFARHAESDRECPNGACTQRGVDAEAAAGTFATVANVSTIVGLALLGLTTYLFLRPVRLGNTSW